MNKKAVDDPTTTPVPRDEFSTTLRNLTSHPGQVTKQSQIDLTDFYGNLVTWIVRTVRVEGRDTVFLQREDGEPGGRLVLPPEVTAVLARHRDGAATVNRKRGAQTAAAKRKALGIVPAFLKAKEA